MWTLWIISSIIDSTEPKVTRYAAFEKFCAENEDVHVELHYHECGMGFVGYWDSELHDEYYEYYEDNITSENIREFIPEHIVDEWCLDEQLENMEEEMEEEK